MITTTWGASRVHRPNARTKKLYKQAILRSNKFSCTRFNGDPTYCIQLDASRRGKEKVLRLLANRNEGACRSGEEGRKPCLMTSGSELRLRREKKEKEKVPTQSNMGRGKNNIEKNLTLIGDEIHLFTAVPTFLAGRKDLGTTV